LNIAVTGSLTLSGTGSADGTINNDGTLVIGDGGSVTVSGTYSQTGTLNIAATATFAVTGSFTNFADGTLTGGTYLIAGTLQFTGANIVTNAANLVLDGSGPGQILDESGNNGMANLAVNDGSGLLTLLNGYNLTTAGDFSNQGYLLIDFTSVLIVSGDYTQGSGATLEIQLGGTPDTGLFGQLNITGNAALDGTLVLTPVNGYTPTTGDAFQIMTFASRNGTDFANGPAGFDLNYDDGTGSLTVTAQ
jgi:fibronectin-binding autotransporter adhesin